jgi:hypothetical protein
MLLRRLTKGLTMQFDLRQYARSAGVVAVIGKNALDRYDDALADFRDTRDRRALAADLLALGVGADDVRRIAAGERVMAITA